MGSTRALCMRLRCAYLMALSSNVRIILVDLDVFVKWQLSNVVLSNILDVKNDSKISHNLALFCAFRLYLVLVRVRPDERC